MFKEIFTRLYGLVVSPKATWTKMLNEGEKAHSLFFSHFLFPIMGMAALSCFVGLIGTEYQPGTLEKVLKEAIVVFTKFFVSFYIIVYVWKELTRKFAISYDKELTERFVGMLLGLYIVVEIIINLLPVQFAFMKCAILGIPYIVWIGTTAFLQIEAPKYKMATIVFSVMILFVPFIMGWLFDLMMPLSITK